MIDLVKDNCVFFAGLIRNFKFKTIFSFKNLFLNLFLKCKNKFKFDFNLKKHKINKFDFNLNFMFLEILDIYYDFK
jgi:hypothetical protein